MLNLIRNPVTVDYGFSDLSIPQWKVLKARWCAWEQVRFDWPRDLLLGED